jgi:hypothetical protein
MDMKRNLPRKFIMRIANLCLLAGMIATPATAAPAGIDKAFAAAFGHAAPFAAMAALDGKKPAQFTYSPAGLVDVAPGTVALISKGKSSCDSCAGALAIHYLKHSGGTFTLVKAWPAIGIAAPSGQVTWTPRPDLEGGPAILVAHDEFGPDCRQSYSQLIALTPDKPVLRANLLTAVHYDPGPEPDHSPAYQAKAKILPGEKGKSFALEYAGTWKLHVDYQRKGDVFVAKQREAPSCQ